MRALMMMGLAVAATMAATAAGQSVEVPKGTLREFVEPAPILEATDEQKAMWPEVREAILAEARKDPLVIADSNESGFFIMAHRLLPLMDAYAWSRDPAFIEALVPVLDNLLEQRYEHPTKPKVWSGWWHYRNSTLKYMPMHGAIMYYRPALKFIAAVRADPELRERYGEKAEAWFTDITEVEIPAWDKRGCWHDLGERGGWYTHSTHYPDPKTGKLIKRTDLYQGSSLAYNKVHEFIQALVLLDRMTDNPWYARRVEKCERFFRNHWRDEGDHVEWNYRDFSGPWDYKNGTDGATKTGYFIHPKGGYYAADVEAIVRCYDAGLAFNRGHVKALVKTNLEFMWRDDHDPPTFRKVDGSYTAEGKYGKGYLWTDLARFSPKVRALWAEQLEAQHGHWGWANGALAYLIATSRPVSWDPLHAE